MRISMVAITVLASSFLGAVIMSQSSGGPTKAETPNATARLAAAERVCKMLHDEVRGVPPGHEGIEHTYLWSMRRMEAQRDVDAARGDRFSALEAHLQRMRDFEVEINKLFQKKIVLQFEMASAHFYVVEAEELLARARAK